MRDFLEQSLTDLYSLELGAILLNITMAVVRLSNTADIKKVRILIIHNSFLLFVVLIFSVMILNP